MQRENQRSMSTTLLVFGAVLGDDYVATNFFAPEPPPSAPAPSPAASASARARREAEVRRRDESRLARRTEATIETESMRASIDNLGGGISELRLLAERYRDAQGEPMNIVTTTEEDFRPLRVELPGADIPVDAVWDIEQESPTSVRLRWEGEGLYVSRRFEAGSGPYQIWQTILVRNTSDEARRMRMRVGAYHYVRRDAEGGGMLAARSSEISSGLCGTEGEVTRKTRDDLEVGHAYRTDVAFAGVENVYFAQVVAAVDGAPEYCGLRQSNRGNDDGDPLGSLFLSALVYPVFDLAPGEERVVRTLAYFGPKEPAALERAGHGLPELVNLGTFAVIARGFAYLLSQIHSLVGNWGLAIIILTFFVRLALFPLTQGNFRTMAQMRRLKPELDAINAKHAGDMEKKNAAVTELYRRHNINPLAQLRGCLPIVFQMPVFFALYASLSTNIELFHMPFALWWTDLSAPDPWFVLPVLLGGLMYLQQRITPTSMDPAQQRVMQLMPVIVTVFMLFLPAGLCLYMLTNSVLGIGQQLFNEQRIRRDQGSEPAAATVPEAPVTPSEAAEAGAGRGTKSPRGGGRSRRG